MHFYLRTFTLLAAVFIPSTGMEFASKKAHELEKLFVEDCEDDTKPHGFYGAFLQPCEFTFVKNEGITDQTKNPCTDAMSDPVGKPVPMHWFFNLTEHFDKDDWDNTSSDDFPDADELMLWPDQCVGVDSRCYSLDEMDSNMKDVLSRIFDEVPQGATHVQVDCRGDAVQLSRVVYAFADRFEKGTPTIMAWMVTVVLVFAASTMWCCYGCCSLFSRRNQNSFFRGHRGTTTAAYTVLEDVNPEKGMMAKTYQIELPQKH
mmetsp:Transcript_22191/g.36733  ORF Transcript_22191/g.36733 Transcript_22191/m.36733 type:complete len:260 (+) Transcript_22191:56-835(+)